MWKVAIVQPVTEGFGFNITTESRFGGSSFQSAASAPMVGRTIGLLEQMKHGCCQVRTKDRGPN